MVEACSDAISQSTGAAMYVRAIRVSVVIGALAAWMGCVFLIWSVWTLHPVVSSREILENIATSYLLVWGFYWLLPGRSTREKALRFLLTTTSLVMTILVLELLALGQVVDYRVVFKTPVEDLERRPYNMRDPELLHIHKPHLHARGRDVSSSPNYEYDVRYDHHGFRNAADYPSADIIVIGDSFVEGGQVPEKDLLTTRLANLSGKTIVNLGQSGYGPQQELHVLRRYGVALQPKVCFWLFFEGNDLSDVHNYDQAIVNWKPDVRNFDWFSQRCLTRNSLWALLRRIRPPLPNYPRVIRNHGWFVPAPGKRVRLCFSYFYFANPLSDWDLKAVEETESVLTRAQELCQTHGIKLVVAFVPDKFRVYKALCEFDSNSECQQWVLNDLPQRIKSAVQDISNKIGFVDLTPALVEQATKGSLVYLARDIHWTTAGHRVAAETLVDFLKKSPPNE
jgi:hypothetical protein